MWYFRYELTSFSGEMMSMTSSQRRHTHFFVIHHLFPINSQVHLVGLTAMCTLGQRVPSRLSVRVRKPARAFFLCFLVSFTSASKHCDRTNYFAFKLSLNTASLSATTARTTYFITETWYNKIVLTLLLPSISPFTLMLHFPNQAIHVWTWYHLPSWITRLRYASIFTKNSQEPLILSLLASYQDSIIILHSFPLRWKELFWNAKTYNYVYSYICVGCHYFGTNEGKKNWH